MTDKKFNDIAFTVAFLLVGLAVLMGMFSITWTLGYRQSTNDLPSCEEDEYLYPTDGDGHVAYEGPGEASPDEYACFNFDNLPK